MPMGKMRASGTRTIAVAASLFLQCGGMQVVAAQEVSQKPPTQIAAPPAAPNPDIAFWRAIEIAAITGAIAFAGTLLTFVGTIRNARSQRLSIERQIAAQEKIQKEQFERAEQTQLRQFKEELNRQRDLEEKQRHSLVIAVAIETIVIAARVSVYADQVKVYTQLTEDNIERLRIITPPTLNFEWQNVYLLVSGKALAQIKLLTTMIDRANRRLTQLKSFLGQKSVVPADSFKEHLENLSGLYAACATAADEAVSLLVDQFPEFRDIIDDVKGHLQFSRQRTHRKGVRTEDGGFASSQLIRHPFPPELEP